MKESDITVKKCDSDSTIMSCVSDVVLIIVVTVAVTERIYEMLFITQDCFKFRSIYRCTDRQ